MYKKGTRGLSKNEVQLRVGVVGPGQRGLGYDMQPESFVDWTSQNNDDGDMKNVIEVRLRFSTCALTDSLFRH